MLLSLILVFSAFSAMPITASAYVDWIDNYYTDENGVEYYVEVKTGDGKSFIISPGELQFAKKNPDRYKLFLVYNIDKEVPDYTILPSKFWEDNRFRKTEVIERIEFDF